MTKVICKVGNQQELYFFDFEITSQKIKQMRTLLLTPIIYLFTVLLLASCEKDDDNSNSNTSGTWYVSYYYDKDKVETNNFSGYTFEFKTNGEMTATKNGSTTTGTWSETISRFNITIGTSEPLEDLTDDWVKVEKSDNLIKLKDDNTTHLEELHFARTK